ncbi:MAG: T9SS type A sorting domain-containing protein [Chitinophagaceae bacterium]
MQKKIDLHLNNNILSVYAGGTLSNNTYKWFKDDHFFKTVVEDSTLTVTQSGAYTVHVLNSVATKLVLHSDTIYYAPTTNLIASKNNSLIDDNSFSSKISVYPNPAKTNTTVVFNTTGKYTITVTDLSGEILQTKTGVSSIKQQNFIQLNVSNYSSGIYFITITDEKNKKQTLKLNKE